MMLGFFVEECISLGFCVVGNFQKLNISGTLSDMMSSYMALIVFLILVLSLLLITMIL